MGAGLTDNHNNDHHRGQRDDHRVQLPGSAIVLKETSGPRTYHFGKTVTYVTRSGKVLDEDVVKTRVKVGAPVRVHYVGTGDNVMVDRVIVDED